MEHEQSKTERIKDPFKVPILENSIHRRTNMLLASFIYYLLIFWARFSVLYSGFIHFSKEKNLVFRLVGYIEIDEYLILLSDYQKITIYVCTFLIGFGSMMVILDHLRIRRLFFPRISNLINESILYLMMLISPIISRLLISILILYIDCYAPPTALETRYMCIDHSDYTVIFLLISLLMNMSVTYISSCTSPIIFSKIFNEIESSSQKDLLDISIFAIGLFNRIARKSIFADVHIARYLLVILAWFVFVYVHAKVVRPIRYKQLHIEYLSHCFCIMIFQAMLVVMVNQYSEDDDTFRNSHLHYFMSLIILGIGIKIHKNSIRIEDEYELILKMFNASKVSISDTYIALDSMLNLLKGLDYSTDPPCIQLKSHKLWKRILNIHDQGCKDIYCYCRDDQDKGEHEEVCRKGILLLDSLLNKSSKILNNRKKMLKNYIVFLLDIIGNYGLAIDLLNSKNSLEISLSYLEKRAFQARLRSLMDYYKQWRRLQTPYWERELINNQSGMINVISASIEFAQLTEIAQESIIRILEYQSDFLEMLLTNKSFGRCFYSACKYSDKVDNLLLILTKLEKLTKGSNKYVQLLILYYYGRIKADSNEMKRVLKKLKTIHFCESFYFQDDTDSIKISDVLKTLVVVVGNEKETYHKMIYVTGDSPALLGWRIHNLEGSDLSILLPESMQKIHKHIMSRDSLLNGLIESDDLRRVYCVGSGGVLKPVDIFISMNYLSKTGVTFSASLRFDDSLCRELATIIVGPQGIMEAGNFISQELFEFPSTVNNMNIDLGRRFEFMSLNIVRYLNINNFNHISYEEIVSTQQSLLFWKTYYKWMDEFSCTINTKRGVEKLFITIEDFRFGRPPIRGFIWVLRIDTGDPLYSKKLELNQNYRILYSKLRLIFQKNFMPSTHNSIDFKEEESKDNSKNEIILSNVHETYSEGVNRDGMQAQLSRRSTKKTGIVRRELSDKNKIQTETTIIQRRGIVCSKPVFPNFESSRNTILERLEDSYTIPSFHEVRTPSYYNIFYIIQVLLSIALVAALYGCSARSSLLFDAYSAELVEQSLSISTLFELRKSTQISILGLETCRLLNEGIYNEKDFVKYGVTDAYQHCSDYLTLANRSLLVFNQFKEMIEKASFPELLDKELIYCDDFEYVIFEEKDKKPAFSGLKVNIMEALIYNDGFSQFFVRRNYKDDYIIPVHLNDRDRAKDGEEEQFRRNMIGEFDRHLEKKLDLFSNYIFTIAEKAETVIKVQLAFRGSINTFYLLSSATLLLILSKRITENFEDLLNLKDSAINRKIQILNRLRSNMLELFKLRIVSEIYILSIPEEGKKIEDLQNKHGKNRIKRLNANGKIDQNVAPKAQSFRFGLDRLLISLTALVLILFTIDFLRFLTKLEISNVRSKASRIRINSIYTWNDFNNINNAMLEILLWNNTESMRNTTAMEAFTDLFIPHIELDLFLKLDEDISYEVGSFTAEYQSYMLTKNPCGKLFFIKNPELCKVLYQGILNQGFYKIFKEFVQLSKEIVYNWNLSKKTWQESEDLLQSPFIMSTISKYTEVMTAYFEWINAGLVAVVEDMNNIGLFRRFLFSRNSEVVLLSIWTLIILYLLIQAKERIVGRSQVLIEILQSDLLKDTKFMRTRGNK